MELGFRIKNCRMLAERPSECGAVGPTVYETGSMETGEFDICSFSKDRGERLVLSFAGGPEGFEELVAEASMVTHEPYPNSKNHWYL